MDRQWPLIQCAYSTKHWGQKDQTSNRQIIEKLYNKNQNIDIK